MLDRRTYADCREHRYARAYNRHFLSCLLSFLSIFRLFIWYTWSWLLIVCYIAWVLVLAYRSNELSAPCSKPDRPFSPVFCQTDCMSKAESIARDLPEISSTSDGTNFTHLFSRLLFSSVNCVFNHKIEKNTVVFRL